MKSKFATVRKDIIKMIEKNLEQRLIKEMGIDKLSEIKEIVKSELKKMRL